MSSQSNSNTDLLDSRFEASNECFVIAYKNEYGYYEYRYEHYGSCYFSDSIFEASFYNMSEYYRWQNEVNFWNNNRKNGKYVLVKVIKKIEIEVVE